MSRTRKATGSKVECQNCANWFPAVCPHCERCATCCSCITFHRRVRLPRRGGSQWYKDRRDFSKYAATRCGAPVTESDCSWRAKAVEWQYEGRRHVYCGRCKEFHNEPHLELSIPHLT